MIRFNMKTNFRIIFISIFIFAISCGSTYLYEELAHIHKGMNLDSVIKVIVNNDYSKGLDLINKKIDEDLYILKDNSKILITEKYSPIENEFYIFMFQENRLIYWGESYQFMNSSNQSVKNASIEISSILNEKYID